jgi:hypothetical protein
MIPIFLEKLPNGHLSFCKEGAVIFLTEMYFQSVFPLDLSEIKFRRFSGKKTVVINAAHVAGSAHSGLGRTVSFKPIPLLEN